jgi:iron complex transport system substrate-binding protein
LFPLSSAPNPTLRLLPSASLLATLGLFSTFAVAQGVQPVSRIVTMSPSLTEAVCALGRCAQLVGTDRHSTWPGSVQVLPKVGGLEDAQIERIVTLRPNMVLLGPRSRAGERLQALGVPVMTLDARTHADLKRMLLKLGDTWASRRGPQNWSPALMPSWTLRPLACPPLCVGAPSMWK